LSKKSTQMKLSDIWLF